jgi:Zn-dependent oligopeptidase
MCANLKTSRWQILVLSPSLFHVTGVPISHIFSLVDIQQGYYVYLWAAVLDTDAFNAFKETGDLFNPEVAARFRELLAKSGADEGMKCIRNSVVKIHQ